jgi:hypothetical protein
VHAFLGRLQDHFRAFNFVSPGHYFQLQPESSAGSAALGCWGATDDVLRFRFWDTAEKHSEDG